MTWSRTRRATGLRTSPPRASCSTTPGATFSSGGDRGLPGSGASVAECGREYALLGSVPPDGSGACNSAEFLAANVDALAEAGADIVSRAALGNLAAGDRQRLVETRLAALSGTPEWATAEQTTPGGATVYLAGSIRDGAREGESGRRGFEFDVRTVMLGVEGMPGRAVLAGAALGLSTGSLVLDDGRGKSVLDAVFGSVYGRIDGRDVDGRGFYVGAAAGTSRDRHELGRPTGFSPYPSASARPDGTTRSFLVSGGYDFRRGNTVFGPVFGARWSRSSVDAYVEDAGPIALSVAKQDLHQAHRLRRGRIERRSAAGSTADVLPLRANRRRARDERRRRPVR